MHQELCNLALAERQKPPLDWQYYIFERRREVCSTDIAVVSVFQLLPMAYYRLRKTTLPLVVFVALRCSVWSSSDTSKQRDVQPSRQVTS